MIQIRKLPLIHTAEQFFNTDKVLMVDLLDLGTISKALAADLGDQAFTYMNRIYLPIVTTGSPENFFLNCKNGVLFAFTGGVKGLYKWDGDLSGAIEERKVYDFSAYYRRYKAGSLAISKDNNFLVQRYIKTLHGRPDN